MNIYEEDYLYTDFGGDTHYFDEKNERRLINCMCKKHDCMNKVRNDFLCKSCLEEYMEEEE